MEWHLICFQNTCTLENLSIGRYFICFNSKQELHYQYVDFFYMFWHSWIYQLIPISSAMFQWKMCLLHAPQCQCIGTLYCSLWFTSSQWQFFYDWSGCAIYLWFSWEFVWWISTDVCLDWPWILSDNCGIYFCSDVCIRKYFIYCCTDAENGNAIVLMRKIVQGLYKLLVKSVNGECVDFIFSYSILNCTK